MKAQTYRIKKDLIKTHFSFAKFFFILAGVILLISGLTFVYNNYIRTEPLTFYKDMENCTVVTKSEISHTYNNGKRRSYTIYHVNVSTPAGEKDLKMTVSRSYYEKMSLYNGRNNITISFFKTKQGSLFPSYMKGCSESEAGHQYIECFPPTLLNTVIAVAACVGGGCLGIGLFALRTARRRDESLAVEVAQTGIEQNDDNELLKEFDEAMQRDPYKLTRSPASSRGNSETKKDKTISFRERDELLKEFDKLTADGKYKYKTHD